MGFQPSGLFRRDQVAVVERKPFGKTIFGFWKHRLKGFDERAVADQFAWQHPLKEATKAWHIVVHERFEMDGLVTRQRAIIAMRH